MITLRSTKSFWVDTIFYHLKILDNEDEIPQGLLIVNIRLLYINKLLLQNFLAFRESLLYDVSYEELVGWFSSIISFLTRFDFVKNL